MSDHFKIVSKCYISIKTIASSRGWAVWKDNLLSCKKNTIAVFEKNGANSKVRMIPNYNILYFYS